MQLLYNLSIHFYLLAIRIASLVNVKAGLWVEGRRGLMEKIGKALNGSSAPVAWFHCASLGEFEQGRPLIEKYKKEFPSHRILLTFFSPSGYEIRKNYAGADHVFYLPIDTPSNARKFVGMVKPSVVFFVKYEFWFNLLTELREQKIPVYLVSGIFRRDHYFFKSYGKWAAGKLSAFRCFFVQDEDSVALLKTLGYSNVLLTGDTRFDRVMDVALASKEIPMAAMFAEGSNVLIAGSSWPEDEKLVTGIAPEKMKWIIAPHEISAAHIQGLLGELKTKMPEREILLFSEADQQNIRKARVLVIDNIGMLSSLYQYGHIAFIGGGFGKGIHNVLEAATFGLPVVFGPNYAKFREAKELIRLGGAFSVKDHAELEQTLKLLSDVQVYQTASVIAKNYVKSRAGATEKIMQWLNSNF